MDFLASTAAGKVVDHISSKFSDCIKNFKGQYDDLELANAIRQELLDQYGNEPFYNDLFHFLQLQYLSRLKAMIFKCLKNCYSLF